MAVPLADPGLEADVAALCAIVRDSAGPGEREAAALVAARFAAAGVADVATQPHRFASTYAWTHALHLAAGLPGRWWLSLPALASLELEAGGRLQWLRRLLPTGEGANVVARIPAAGERRATLVVTAHLDAAQTGLVWHPALARASSARRLRTRAMDPVMAPLALGFVLTALPAGRRRTPRGPKRLHRSRFGPLAARPHGSRTPTGPMRSPSSRFGPLALLRGAGRALLLTGIAGNLDVARSPTVPGANDDATGVAGLLALARAWAAAPLPGVDIVLAAVGSEEAGMGGMRAFLDAERLDPATSFVLGLDTLGGTTPIVARAEGALRTHRYRPEDLAQVDAGADRAGVPRPQRWRIGAWTDPVLALHRGIPAAVVLSVGPDGGYANYHLPSDTPDHVDWDGVRACVAIARGVGEAMTQRGQTPLSHPVGSPP